MQIHSIEHIKERLTVIQSILEAHYDSDDGHLLNQRLTEISAYMAESGKLKADAKFHYISKMKSEIMGTILKLIPDYTSSTVQNTLLKSLAAEEAQLVEFADRVNATSTHQVDAMRSQLSYIKSLPR
jgi:hypothetical protein